MTIERGEPGAIRQFVTDVASLSKPVEKLVSQGVEKYSKLKGLSPEGTLKGEFKGDIKGPGTYDQRSDAGRMSTIVHQGITTKYPQLDKPEDTKVLKKFFSMSEEKQLKFLQDNGQCKEYNVAQYRYSPEYDNMQQALKEYQKDQAKLAGYELMLDPSLKGASKLIGALGSTVVSAAIMNTPRAALGAEVVTENILYKAKQQVQDLKKEIQSFGQMDAKVKESSEERSTTVEKEAGKLVANYKFADAEGKKELKNLLETAKDNPDATPISREWSRAALEKIEKNEQKNEAIEAFNAKNTPEDRREFVNAMVLNRQFAKGSDVEKYEVILDDIKGEMLQRFHEADVDEKERIRDEVVHEIVVSTGQENTQSWYIGLLDAFSNEIQLQSQGPTPEEKAMETEAQGIVAMYNTFSTTDERELFKFSLNSVKDNLSSSNFDREKSKIALDMIREQEQTLEDKAEIKVRTEEILARYNIVGSESKEGVKANIRLKIDNKASSDIEKAANQAALNEINKIEGR